MPDFKDRIEINQLEVSAILGIYEQERLVKQKLLIDIHLHLDSRKAAETDDIHYTVNYHALSIQIKQYVEQSSHLLVETLAQKISELCLGYEMVDQVTVKVSKPDAIDFVKNVGLSITRKR
ncbi:MAG: dihydroneopterin aldolase [Candidatus Heimdallarchaeota archaeon]|nr:dihydroneopterin aldolase [Candidatus Heimdallarchaeota archaeon]